MLNYCGGTERLLARSFAFNLERVPVRVRLQPRWQSGSVQDLINESELALQDGSFEVEIGAWGVAVVHCDER